ncbi:MAG: cupin domain-containing protein [Steroidobacteraceae bacterium]
MSEHRHRWSLIAALAVASVAALLAMPLIARAQHHAGSQSAAPRAGNGAIMRRDLIGLPGKEVVMSTIEVAPGASSPPHRHNAQVFVYVLQGRMIMQVKGGPRETLGPGGTFYESPTDIHTVSANASKTEPAKFLAILIKDKDQPAYVPVPPGQAK